MKGAIFKKKNLTINESKTKKNNAAEFYFCLLRQFIFLTTFNEQI